MQPNNNIFGERPAFAISNVRKVIKSAFGHSVNHIVNVYNSNLRQK